MRTPEPPPSGRGYCVAGGLRSTSTASADLRGVDKTGRLAFVLDLEHDAPSAGRKSTWAARHGADNPRAWVKNVSITKACLFPGSYRRPELASITRFARELNQEAPGLALPVAEWPDHPGH